MNEKSKKNLVIKSNYQSFHPIEPFGSSDDVILEFYSHFLSAPRPNHDSRQQRVGE
jgi:hypothetical protein